MKCYSCGGEVGLTDKVCPYCGRDLTETASYRADEEKYQQRSEKTKKKAGGIIKENLSMVISAGIMIVLVIGVIIASYVNENAYFFKKDAIRRESVKNYDECSAKMKEYLDAGDYTGFAAYKEAHNIDELNAPYDDLELLWSITEQYVKMVHVVESSVIYAPDADRYKPEDNVDDCQSAIDFFYREFEMNLSDIDEDPYKEYIYGMRNQADVILEVYLGLDENGRKEYFEGSDVTQRAYLEGVLIDE